MVSACQKGNIYTEEIKHNKQRMPSLHQLKKGCKELLNKGGWEVMYKGWPNFPASVTAQVQTKRSAAAGGYSGVMFTVTLLGR